MLEDYAIQTRNGRVTGTGRYYINQRGTRKEAMEFREYYKTNLGEFSPEEWKRMVMREIEAEGEQELLEQIKQHCREHCARLHKKSEIEEYAMECLCNRAYECWTDFQSEIIWM